MRNGMARGFFCGLAFAVLIVLLVVFTFSKLVERRRKCICLKAVEENSETELQIGKEPNAANLRR